jgi:hypothetical protein
MNEVIIYQNNNSNIQIEVQFEQDTVWLTQSQMGELFGKARVTINEHIKNIFKKKELEETDVVRKVGNSDFSTKPTNFYNLDVIISVGYRVKSKQGTQFRIWATRKLKEILVKGCAINQKRLDELQQTVQFIQKTISLSQFITV